jgi:membrane dipeptidase
VIGRAASPASRGAIAAILVAALLGPSPARGTTAEERPLPVVDLHVDLSYQANYERGTFARATGQFPAADLAQGGVVGVVLPLFVPHRVSKTGPRLSDLESSYQNVVKWIPKTPPYAAPGCAEPPPGKVRTFLAFEGAAPLASDPAAPARWASRGVRIFGLVHTSDNALATSSTGKGAGGGLTDAGRAFVRRVYDAGAVVDVSHASDAATDEILRFALAEKVPVVATHSNARALVAHPRNLTDDQIRDIGRTGGVVGVNFHSRFLVPHGRAKLADVLAHVLHLVKVAGVEHVAIGSDFEGDITAPEGLEGVRHMPRLSTALEAAGMTRDDVERVFSRNALRVLCGAPKPPAAP